MPSSISSSDALQRWALALLIALIVAVAICGAQEYRWRQRGYRPGILDTAQLWSMQRARAYATEKTPLLLLGASRIEYGVDMPLLKQLLPHYQPVMLAQNGHYPLATLTDLGSDEKFRGVVVCDVDARGLANYYRDAQQAYVDYFRRQWSPSWRVHRLLLTQWQRALLISDASFGVVRETTRLIGAPGWPPRSPVTLHADRSGDLDFSENDKAALMRSFVDGFKQDMLAHPPQGTDAWLKGLQPVAAAVAAIQKRGGTVIFVQTPTGGELHDVENAAYPRSEYWDRLSDATGARTLTSDDVPAWRSFQLPDGSHVDQRDKPAYTRVLVDALLARGWLTP